MKVKGELLASEGTFFFRVYEAGGNFVDYEIVANDLSIEIDDPFVHLIKIDGESGVLDYTDEVLGR